MKRPVLYCAVFFCLGIALGYFFNTSFTLPLTLSIASVILAVLLSGKKILSHIFLYIALAAFGAAYYQNYQVLPDNHIARFLSEEPAKAYLKGVVADDPARKKAFYGSEKTVFTLRSQLLIEDSSVRIVSGLVKVDLYTSSAENAPRFGDEIVMKGVLSKPDGLKNPGTFDYPAYLGIKNIYAIFGAHGDGSVRIIKSGTGSKIESWAYTIRNAISSAVTRNVDARYSGLLNAVLVGQRNDLDSSVMDDFIKTGTVHVIAISGLNIALIAGIFIFIFRMFGMKKKFNLILTSALLILYCFVAGASPPVVRATIMFVIVCLGYLIDRESDILNSLAIAAFIILLGNPKELFDPSFQLSFVSILSIVLFEPKIKKAIISGPEWLVKSVSVSIAATVGVMPVVAKYFNIVSPIAVIANIVIVPALFVIVIVSFVFLLFSFTGLSFFAIQAGAVLSFLISVTFRINHLLAGVPFSYIRLPAPSFPVLLIYYAALFSLFFMQNRKRLIIPLLLAANIIVWSQGMSGGDRLVKVMFFDVGKGDACLVRLPDRGAILIDGGSGGIEGATDMGKNIIAPYLWNHNIFRLDAVIITHFHEDHLGGLLYILKNFKVGCVIDNDSVPAEWDGIYDEYKKVLKQKSVRRIASGAGDEITVPGGVKISVMNPVKSASLEDSNDNSMAFKLSMGGFSILFCGDISSKSMPNLMPYGNFLKSDIVKIPHHGGSLGEERIAKDFFEEVSPKLFIVSTSARYTSFSASKNTSALLNSLGPDIYETNKCGAVEILSDGTGFEIKPYIQKN